MPMPVPKRQQCFRSPYSISRQCSRAVAWACVLLTTTSIRTYTSSSLIRRRSTLPPPDSTMSSTPQSQSNFPQKSNIAPINHASIPDRGRRCRSNHSIQLIPLPLILLLQQNLLHSLHLRINIPSRKHRNNKCASSKQVIKRIVRVLLC